MSGGDATIVVPEYAPGAAPLSDAAPIEVRIVLTITFCIPGSTRHSTRRCRRDSGLACR